ncbi:hypothetical protein AB1Y20_008110 [Prymnesium parvum]|uniref:Hexosyltransferase n=1 Tax=Prymnesium parvum TaxID=97485 RepID=A0AB34IVP3_PRYPA
MRCKLAAKHRDATPDALLRQWRHPSSSDARQHVVLALGMTSAPHHHGSRDRVRATVLSAPCVLSGDVVFRFLVGFSACSPPLDWRKDDMLIMDDVLDGRGRGKQCSCLEKTYAWFRHAVWRWPLASFYGKTEDDAYVNLQQLLHDLNRKRVRDAPALLYGLLALYASPPLESYSAVGCFLGEMDAQAWALHPTRQFKPSLQFDPQCRTNAPAPFPTGPLAILSSGLARSLFVSCGHVRAWFEQMRARNRAANGCSRSHSLLSSTMEGTSCDGAFAGWFVSCKSNVTLASMTWTKSHWHWTADNRKDGFVPPDPTSIVVHGLKQDDDRTWTKVQPDYHAWYWRKCGAYGCHSSRYHNPVLNSSYEAL